jgi:hypothetical protein
MASGLLALEVHQRRNLPGILCLELPLQILDQLKRLSFTRDELGVFRAIPQSRFHGLGSLAQEL